MKGIVRLIGVVLLTALLLGVVGSIPGYAQGPVEEPAAGRVLERVPPSPPTDLDLERLAEELLRKRGPAAPAKSVEPGVLSDLPHSPEDDGWVTYSFAMNTALFRVNKPRGSVYFVGEGVSVEISTSVPGYFILLDWHSGQWSWFDLGWVAAHRKTTWYGTVGPPPGPVLLIAINLLNWDYGWTWFQVR